MNEFEKAIAAHDPTDEMSAILVNMLRRRLAFLALQHEQEVIWEAMHGKLGALDFPSPNSMSWEPKGRRW